MGNIKKVLMDKQYIFYEEAIQIASIANKAMLYEVACYPSPGLVSPVCTGAHKDMNFFTFIDSSSAIFKYLMIFAQKGFTENSPKDIFCEIREIGIKCEAEMLRETRGINTHKGMIFLMGISCAAVAKAMYEKRPFKEINCIIKEMVEGISERELVDKELKNKLSHGEEIYEKYGSKGIRGEVEKGIPIVFDFALDFYKQNIKLNTNDRMVKTLIGIIQFCDDSNIIYRHSIEVLHEVQQKSIEILELSKNDTKLYVEEVDKLNQEFIRRNISPGGSADLLGITMFFYYIEKYMAKNKLKNS